MVVSRAASGSSRWPLIVLVASWCLVATLASEESATSSVIVDLNYLNQTIMSDGDEIGNLTITSTLNPEPATSRANKRPLFSTGNKLWDSLIAECIKKPTFACIQKNVYSFLGESLDVGDFNVSNRLVFTRNRVDFTKYTREANEEEQQHDEEVDNEIPDARGGNYVFTYYSGGGLEGVIRFLRIIMKRYVKGSSRCPGGSHGS